MKWLARGEARLPPGDSWLSPAESARAAGMRFTKRRTEFLVARWAAKEAIGRLTGPGTEAARIEVRHHASGAPEAYLDGEPMELGISLTDRAGWAVCLLAGPPARIGCDLELVEPRSVAFVRDYFTDAERRFIADAGATGGDGGNEGDGNGGGDGGDGRALAANLLWSAKESALKVLRTGLRRDTRTVEVTAGPAIEAGVGTAIEAGVGTGATGWAPLTVRTAEGAVFPGWWCRFGGFVLTVAADRPLPPPLSLEDPPALASAVPLHTWLDRPEAGGRSPDRTG